MGPDRPDHGVRRNAAFALAAQLTTAAFTAALTIYLVRALGPSGYGTFALAMAIGTVLLLPSDFGISQSAARFIAERRGERGAVASVLGMALRLKLALSALVAGAVLGLAGPIANAYGVPELAWPLRGIAVALFGQSLFLLPQTAFIALRRLPLSFRLVLTESAMELTASVALVAAAGGATAAAFGRGAGYLIGALVGIILLRRLLGGGAFARRGSDVGPRRLAGYAGALFVVDGSFALFSQVGVLIIGALLGPASAGLLAAPLRLVTMLNYPGLAVAQAVAPRLARARGERPDTRAFPKALVRLALLQAAIVAGMLALAEPVVRIGLGADFARSADVMRALAPAIFLAGLAPLVSLSLNYLGQARRRVPIAIASLAVNAGLCLALIPAIGLLGAAAAAGAAYALYVGAHLRICAKELDLSPRSPGWRDAMPRLDKSPVRAALLPGEGRGGR